MRKTLVIGLLVLFLGLCPQVSLAWNATGHMLVALIAYRRLDEAQRKQVDELLTHHPHYATLLTEKKPPEVSTQEWAFLRAAVWPDDVRPAYAGKPQKPPSITKYHQATWHYVTIYYVPPGEQKNFN